jgi:hypothetical protein
MLRIWRLKMKTFLKAVALTWALVLAVGPVTAGSDSVELQALKQQIAALEERVEALESARTFTSFMPVFSERFHVLHRAGEAGDWAVASHELEEMKRLAVLSTTIDAEKGNLLQAMMEPTFGALGKAIEHGNHKKLQAALEQTVNTCNSCHAATDSAFINVTLDVPDSLSMRHPHRFTRQATPEGHHHGMPKQMEQ